MAAQAIKDLPIAVQNRVLLSMTNWQYANDMAQLVERKCATKTTRLRAVQATIESAEAAIDGSIEHYEKKLDFVKGPKVVKTFK